MIAFLKGTLAGKTATTAYIEVNGVGYAVGMSQASLSKLPEAGAPVEVHTFLQVRDDALALYGFLALEEKALFERLIGVGGVGPKVALAALSAFSPAGLVAAVQAQDVAAVQRIPGGSCRYARGAAVDGLHVRRGRRRPQGRPRRRVRGRAATICAEAIRFRRSADRRNGLTLRLSAAPDLGAPSPPRVRSTLRRAFTSISGTAKSLADIVGPARGTMLDWRER